jgi:type IV fimbrial biogenesis protein FimT
MCSRTRTQPGFTLFELLVTITVAAMVIAIGVPSFAKFGARNRQAAEINALFHAVHLARKTSIMRRQVISLCPSTDGLRCAPGRDWSMGWLMFENLDRDEPPQVDAAEPVISFHAVDERVRVSANRRGFTLRATHLRATNGTLIVCDRAGRIPAKALVVSYTGRPRVTLADSRGKPYACAH